jgi:SAM-dependent methyltransferase
VGTPALVSPGARFDWYERWTRAKLQAWAWRRLERYGRLPFAKAVDLGCGYGDWTERLAARSREIVAVDLSPGFVEQTRQRLASAGHANARVICGDVCDLGEEPLRQADLLSLGAVLMYLEDEEAAALLGKLRRNIGASGLLYQRDLCAANGRRERRNVRPGFFSVYRRPGRYVEMAGRSGFRLLEARRSTSIYAEQSVFETVARRSERAAGAAALAADLLWRLATLHWRTASWSFFFAPA